MDNHTRKVLFVKQKTSKSGFGWARIFNTSTNKVVVNLLIALSRVAFGGWAGLLTNSYIHFRPCSLTTEDWQKSHPDYGGPNWENLSKILSSKIHQKERVWEIWDV